MKKAIITMVFVATVAVLSTVLWAEEATQTTSGKQTVNGPVVPEQVQRHRQVRERGVGHDPNAARQTFQDVIQRRTQEHQAEIKELENIKNLAEEEKATKTAAAIQKLITTKDEAFKKQLAEVEKRNAQIKERAEYRKQNLANEAKNKAAAAEGKDKK
jgi:hypothetical protein